MLNKSTARLIGTAVIAICAASVQAADYPRECNDFVEHPAIAKFKTKDIILNNENPTFLNLGESRLMYGSRCINVSFDAKVESCSVIEEHWKRLQKNRRVSRAIPKDDYLNNWRNWKDTRTGIQFGYYPMPDGCVVMAVRSPELNR